MTGNGAAESLAGTGGFSDFQTNKPFLAI